MLGVLGLRRTRAHGTRGRGLAVAGLVLGTIGTLVAVLGVAAAVMLARATAPLPSDVTAARDAHVQQLTAGNCLGELPSPTADGTVDTVRVVPCADPHVAQVVSEFAFDDAAVWPGQQAADARVARSCVLDAEETAAGATVLTWAPTEDGWADGDRTGLCVVVAADGSAG